MLSKETIAVLEKKETKSENSTQEGMLQWLKVG